MQSDIFLILIPEVGHHEYESFLEEIAAGFLMIRLSPVLIPSPWDKGRVRLTFSSFGIQKSHKCLARGNPCMVGFFLLLLYPPKEPSENEIMF
jgi:hypothetical protein